jgi:hypothetical protein
MEVHRVELHGNGGTGDSTVPSTPDIQPPERLVFSCSAQSYKLRAGTSDVVRSESARYGRVMVRPVTRASVLCAKRRP